MTMMYRVEDEEGILYEGEWFDEALSFVKAAMLDGRWVSAVGWDAHYQPMPIKDEEPPKKFRVADYVELIKRSEIALGLGKPHEHSP